MIPNILIVDDEKHMCRSLELLLSAEMPCRVRSASNYYEALDLLDSSTNMVITDLTMPGKNGLELLREIKKVSPDTEVVLMTAFSTVDSAVQALQEGACEYLVKPFASEKLLEVVRRLLKRKQRPRKSQLFELPEGRFGDLIGSSRAMQHLFALMSKASEIDSPVLITGESGVGKDAVAQAVHYSGVHKHLPFVNIRCGMVEPEVLGRHLKELFYPPQSAKMNEMDGMLESAGGTLCFDEIGDLPDSLQTELLRLLDAPQNEHGDGMMAISWRLIATSSKSLPSLIQQGKFREALYFRINVFSIDVPPLRDRREDIPLLVSYFIKAKSQQFKIPVRPITRTALTLLQKHVYTGNLRELENIIERAVLVAKRRSIRPEDLAVAMHDAGKETRQQLGLSLENLPLERGWLKLNEVAKALEKELLLRALQTYRGISNQELAALLGTTRRILELRLRQFDLDKY